MENKILTLKQDKQGLIWDLLLYIPTVVALLGLAASFWFQNNPNLSYLLVFLGSFFAIAGTNRILNTRLMLLPNSPVSIEIANKGTSVKVVLKNKTQIELVKQVKFFKDMSGKSIGLSGMDGTGKLKQFVFHKGQFVLLKDFDLLLNILKKN